MYLFLWWHFEISLVLLFNKFLWLALAVIYFSVKHRSHLLDPHLYVEAQAATLHFTLKLMPLSCSLQMCFESSVLFVMLMVKWICVVINIILRFKFSITSTILDMTVLICYDINLVNNTFLQTFTIIITTQIHFATDITNNDREV